jgi:dTDP-glucose 4,6-dehydratase
MARVLITGGAGFIGSALLRHLLTDGELAGSVLNMDKLTYAANPRAIDSVAQDARYRFAKTDIVDLAEVRRVFREFDPDVVIHLAAETHVDRSIDDPFDFVRTNVVGTCNLLHAALEIFARKSDFRFVHVSTDEVYGSLAPGRAAVEGDVYRPSSPYSASKASADHMAHAWYVTYGLPVITTNCTNNYGPYQYPEKLIPVMTLNALSGRPLPVYGDGGNVRDWLYVEDHARAIWRVATAGVAGANYNISGRTEKTNLEIVEAICANLDARRPRADGRSYRTQIQFVADRPGHDRRYALDSTRIERELGWTPAVSFADGMHATVEWYVHSAAELTQATGAAYAKRRGLIA